LKAIYFAKLIQSPPKTTHRYFGMQNTALRQRSSYEKRRDKITGKEQDAETGLYYYGARYLDPKTSRWLSGDPAMGEYFPVAPVNDEAKKHNGNLPGQGGVFNYVNLHAYHYAGNNPVRYIDPDGRDDVEEQEAAMQAYLEEAWKSKTYGPDLEVYDEQFSISDRITKSAEVNLGRKYGNGNQCDDFVENVLAGAGVNSSDYFAGSAATTTVQEHIDKVTRNGTNISEPTEGAYVVFMNGSPKNLDPHAGILVIDKNGKINFYHSSSNNPGGLSRRETKTNGQEYSSIKDFQNDFAYKNFYYQAIR